MIDERIVSPKEQTGDDTDSEMFVKTSKSLLMQQKGAARRWITYCCLALRGLAKQHWPQLWQKSSGSGLERRRRR